MSGIITSFVGGSYGSVPGAPTIGTATQTGSSTATVAYTAPASNGGLPITSYTAVSTPSGGTGTLSQAGSGTITVSGLSPSTSYTFVVFATNSLGNSPNSAASNSITTTAAISQQAFTVAGSYSWVAPVGVTKVSAVVIGGGGGGGPTGLASCPCTGLCVAAGGGGAGGGGLAYKNNITVVPGNSYAIVVGVGGTSGACSTVGGTSTATLPSSNLSATGGGRGRVRSAGTYVSGSSACGATGLPSGNGGQGQISGVTGGGGGGAAGYSSTLGGGNGGNNQNGGCNGNGGGGGGGSGGRNPWGGSAGGGVGLLGQGGNGAGGPTICGSAGTPGGGGSSGSSGAAAVGGAYGGGGAGSGTSSGAGAGGVGAVRIIWPGNTRSFPSTCTGNLP